MRVYFRASERSDHICFTFDYLAQPSAPPNIPAARLIERHGAAHAHLVTAADDWYQNADLPDALAAMRRLRERYARASTYGGSMGGYAALLFSGLLSAERALALVPQFSIDPGKVPFETRWHAIAGGLSFVHDTMAEALAAPSRRIIVYDPACHLDKLHVDLIRSLCPVERRPLPFAGHYPLQVLGRHLTSFIGEMLFDEARSSSVAPLRRQCRRESSRYFCEMGVWFARRRNDAAAFRSLSRAYLADPTSTSAIEATFQIMQGQPAHTRILQHMLLRLIRHEQPSWTHYDNAQAQLLAAIQHDSGGATDAR